MSDDQAATTPDPTGQQAPTTPAGPPSFASAMPEPPLVPPTEERILEALKEVVDPELGLDVVNLGLVYGIQVDDKGDVTIDMTLTTPACPLTDQLEWDIQMVLDGIANHITVNWVWLPPWTLEKITDEGREQLRAIGYNL